MENFFSLLFILLSTSLTDGTKSNILITIGTGVGWGDIGSNNPMFSHDRTPNIDKLADSGINFLDYHIGGSTAGPSMAALLTGRHGQRTGVRNNFSPYSHGGLPEGEKTLADFLKSAGYVTGYIGVWDLGHQPQFLPTSRGFDYFYGSPFDITKGCMDYDPAKMFVPPGAGNSCSENEVQVPLMESDLILEQPLHLDNLSTPILYAKSKKFIEYAKEQDKPFLLILAPNQINLPLYDSTTEEPLSKATLISQLDEVVGMTAELLQTFYISNNTINIFTSKTGPIATNCDFVGNSCPYLGLWQKHHYPGTAPFMGTNWEAALKVPFVVSWPGFITSTHPNTRLSSAVDMVVTLADVIGFSLPMDRVFDGVSVKDDFYGIETSVDRSLFFLESDTPEIFAFRRNNYKVYFRTNGARGCNTTYNATSLAPAYHPQPLVFDLDTDRSEMTNITYDMFYAAHFTECKLTGDQDFSSTPGLKSVVDETESDSALLCCNTECTPCYSKPPLQDMIFLIFGQDNTSSDTYIEGDQYNVQLWIIPVYGIVFMCLAMTSLTIFVLYKSYTVFVAKKFYYGPVDSETEAMGLLGEQKFVFPEGEKKASQCL